MNKPYLNETYFAMALDPIHIGTGVYTLGRVDNPIVRDFDGVPKIPGTSIEGNARTYAYFQELGNNKACALGKKIKDNEKEILPCGKCQICFSYGYTRDDRSLQGMAIFSDARILFFPVASLIGPVWVTSSSILDELNICKDKDNWKKLEHENDGKEYCVVSEDLGNKLKNAGYLNFGWLLLPLKKKNKEVVTHDIDSMATFGNNGFTFEKRNFNQELIFKRLVIVSNSVFGQIVNSNLEVRTSVSIDPETGAAQERALFTYEAIPRTTVFYFEVVYQNPEHFEISNKVSIDEVISTVEKGFELFDSLGVGGMGTRGFGKLKIFGLDKKFDPVELAKIQVKNINNKLQKIDEELKSASDEKKAKLENEKESIKNKIRSKAEMLSKLAEIYKAIEGD